MYHIPSGNKLNRVIQRHWGMKLPSNHSVTLAHVLQVFHELPHGGICHSDFINVHCQHGEARAPKEIGYIPSIFGDDYFVLSIVRGQSYLSLGIREEIFHLLVRLRQAGGKFCGSKAAIQSRAKDLNCYQYLSSNNVSPPNIAPRNRPSGCRASFICTRVPASRVYNEDGRGTQMFWPGRSLTQCKLRQETIASWEFWGMLCKRFSSSACSRSTLTAQVWDWEDIGFGWKYVHLQSLSPDHDWELPLELKVKKLFGCGLSKAMYIPLESSMIDFSTLSVSSNLEKCPGPEPRSRTVLKFRLMSCTRVSLTCYCSNKVSVPKICPTFFRPPHFEHNRQSYSARPLPG